MPTSGLSEWMDDSDIYGFLLGVFVDLNNRVFSSVLAH